MAMTTSGLTVPAFGRVPDIGVIADKSSTKVAVPDATPGVVKVIISCHDAVASVRVLVRLCLASRRASREPLRSLSRAQE